MKKLTRPMFFWGIISCVLLTACDGKETKTPDTDPVKNTLEVEPRTAISFEAEDNNNVTLTVTTDASDWTFTKPDWVKADQTDDKLVVNAEDNTAETRSGEIVISAGDADAVKISVTQKEKESTPVLPDPDPIWETNLVLNSTETSESSYYPDEYASADKLVDGDYNIYYGPARRSTDASAIDPDWAIVKLSQKQLINQIWIYPRPNSAQFFPRAFNVYLSEDGQNWGTSIISETGYESGAGVQKWAFEQTKAEYVKLEITGFFPLQANIWLVQIGEMEVYLTEKPLPEPTVIYNENLCIGGTISWESNNDWMGGGASGNMIDGNLNTPWISGNTSLEGVTVMLSNPQPINKVVIWPRSEAVLLPMFPVDFTIKVATANSSNEADWTTVVSETNYPRLSEVAGQVFTFTEIQAKYVKLEITKLGVHGEAFRTDLGEFEVYLTSN